LKNKHILKKKNLSKRFSVPPGLMPVVVNGVQTLTQLTPVATSDFTFSFGSKPSFETKIKFPWITGLHSDL